MYLIEVEFYSGTDMNNIKARYIDGTSAVFTVSKKDYEQFIEESENRDDVKKYTVYECKQLFSQLEKENIMAIIIVNWSSDNRNIYIDGRIPIFENNLQAGYWIPYEQVDLFVKLALCDDNVSSVTVYSYKEYFRK